MLKDSKIIRLFHCTTTHITNLYMQDVVVQSTVITSVCSLIFMYQIRISTKRATMVPAGYVSTTRHVSVTHYPFSHLLAAKDAYRRGYEVHVSLAF